ncbi:unnamed protein product [Protopolystoma xenopodis]|uniref:Uncharacterized protein n=1 Tax=Protopolystoma xenopodis TaxID=117903 RepID=A0A448WG89_9PLAT|nr:unnamed protein product [Protopolystoma xenopodis]
MGFHRFQLPFERPFLCCIFPQSSSRLDTMGRHNPNWSDWLFRLVFSLHPYDVHFPVFVAISSHRLFSAWPVPDLFALRPRIHPCYVGTHHESVSDVHASICCPQKSSNLVFSTLLRCRKDLGTC